MITFFFYWKCGWVKLLKTFASFKKERNIFLFNLKKGECWVTLGKGTSLKRPLIIIHEYGVKSVTLVLGIDVYTLLNYYIYYANGKEARYKSSQSLFCVCACMLTLVIGIDVCIY